MNDSELLFNASNFCREYHSESKGCKRCPLTGHVCISYDGNMNLGEKDKDDHINFTKFIDEFNYMTQVISNWAREKYDAEIDRI